MVFASICENVSSAFIFASISSDQFSYLLMRAASTLETTNDEYFVNFPPAGASFY